MAHRSAILRSAFTVYPGRGIEGLYCRGMLAVVIELGSSIYRDVTHDLVASVWIYDQGQGFEVSRLQRAANA